MKKLKKLNIFFVTLITLSSFSLVSAEDDCVVCTTSNLSILSQGSANNISQLNQISEANKVRVDLAEARISYSRIGLSAGRAKIFLTISEGKLVDLNIEARVGMLGINEDIKKKVTIDRLKRGQPLEFSMGGAERPTLRIRPSAGFSETGGTTVIEIWNGSKYEKETINISKSLGNQYKVYQGNVATTNEVTGISINMRGMSISDMYIGNYKIETR